MESINRFIEEKLAGRASESSLRVLSTENTLIDFCSNDYLGFGRSTELRSRFLNALERYPDFKMGSGGSRLLSGNDDFAEALELRIAKFHDTEAALLYNSGYDANVGLFSSLPQRGDTIICDELIHASIIDGVRLSHASRFIFKHNDMDSLKQKLNAAQGRIFIVVESVYSMDGDEAPLDAICTLAEQFNAGVVVDEAHAIGVFGEDGKGLVHALNLSDRVFARVITFGKALGVHGAAVLCSATFRSYLINFSRSFMYTTAPSFLSNLEISTAYNHLVENNYQDELHQRITFFKSKLEKNLQLMPSRSAIQIIMIPGNNEVKRIASGLQQSGFDVRAILSPTVQSGSERLRICLHNHNSYEEIEALCKTLNSICER